MPPSLRGQAGVGGHLPGALPLPLSLPTSALKHLPQVISTFEKGPVLSEDLGSSPSSQQMGQS